MRKIELSAKIKNHIRNIQKEFNFKKETGGILIGKLDEASDYLITDMSFPYPSDRQSRFRFSRKSTGHQEFMDELWEESEHTKAYLGEWHTHDQDTPAPSLTDKRTWKRISKNDNNFDQCFFLIIGRRCYTIWTVLGNNVIEVKRGKNNGSD